MVRSRRPNNKDLLCELLTSGLDGLIQRLELYKCNDKAVHVSLLKELKDRNVSAEVYDPYEAWVVNRYGLFTIPGEGRRKPKIGDPPFQVRVQPYNGGFIVRVRLDEYGVQEDDLVEIAMLPEGVVVTPVRNAEEAADDDEDEEATA